MTLPVSLSGHEGPAPSRFIEPDGLRAQDENKEQAMLNLVCAVAEHNHESISTVLAWPWKLFCEMACRLARYSYDEKRRREAEDEQRETEEDWDDLKRKHAQVMGRG